MRNALFCLSSLTAGAWSLIRTRKEKSASKMTSITRRQRSKQQDNSTRSRSIWSVVTVFSYVITVRTGPRYRVISGCEKNAVDFNNTVYMQSTRRSYHILPSSPCYSLIFSVRNTLSVGLRNTQISDKDNFYSSLLSSNQSSASEWLLSDQIAWIAQMQPILTNVTCSVVGLSVCCRLGADSCVTWEVNIGRIHS